MKVDLHTHTNCSDGRLEPGQLVELAQNLGLEMLAITDHDTVAGCQHLANLETGSLRLVPGIEFSSQWGNIGVHIVGLNIQIDSDAIAEGVAHQQQARRERAGMIAERLARLGFGDCLDPVLKIAGHDNIGRWHFARHLVDIGAAKNTGKAFKKYLGAGKPGDVRHLWPDPRRVVRWIREAGGTAVLAHPAKYKLTNSKLQALIEGFASAGGQAMEVISGRQLADTTRKFAALCRRYDLRVSCGSDFHAPEERWRQPGRFAALPPDCRPVWNDW